MVQTPTSGMTDLYSRTFKSWSEMLNAWTGMASSYPATMPSMGMDNWLKPWSDMFKTWSQAASSYSPEEFAKIGPEGWFKPYREFMDNWSRAYQGFADMSKGSATPVESMKDLNQA
ncbi:MAG: hypothetical protein FJZ95_03995, partial [Chloroflexi bacterium]|nr:hypothetical protein [Chloroflexota bacterium]